MYFYKKEDGSIVSCYKPLVGLEEITEEAFNERMTATEKKLEKIAAHYERTRPLTTEEVTALLIRQSVNTLEVDDNTALRMMDFYPAWAENTAYTVGYKVTYNCKLWRCVMAHTSQAAWHPEDAPTLWEAINETHSGTMDDPIPYDGNMALLNGLYYVQDYVVYRCNRDTGAPIYHALADLVGVYVEAT